MRQPPESIQRVRFNLTTQIRHKSTLFGQKAVEIAKQKFGASAGRKTFTFWWGGRGAPLHVGVRGSLDPHVVKEGVGGHVFTQELNVLGQSLASKNGM